MSLDYHDILKSPDELKVEEINRTSKLLDDQAQQTTRKNWSELQNTKRYIEELEGICILLNAQLLEQAQNLECTNEDFRYKAVEVQTLRKTINLLKYGRYDYNSNTTKQ